MAHLSRQFDVLRIVIPAPHDDEVLDAACDKKLAIVFKPQISGPQETWLSRPGRSRLEGIFTIVMIVVRAAPVPERHARTSDPDFSDLACAGEPARLRVNNDCSLLPKNTAATYQQPARFGFRCRHHSLA